MTTNIGHNKPPSETEILKDRLENDNKEQTQRAHDLVNAADRLPEITDAVTAGKVGDYVKMVKKHTTLIESIRTKEKKPYTELASSVDVFFNGYKTMLTTAVNKAQAALNVFAVAEAARVKAEREKAAEEARAAAQAELDKAAEFEAQNKPKLAEAVFDQAKASDKDAGRAEKLAASNTKLVSTAGESSTTGIRTRWVGQMTDRSMLDLELLRPFLPEAGIQQAINAFIAAGGRGLIGAEIKEVSTAVVR